MPLKFFGSAPFAVQPPTNELMIVESCHDLIPFYYVVLDCENVSKMACCGRPSRKTQAAAELKRAEEIREAKVAAVVSKRHGESGKHLEVLGEYYDTFNIDFNSPGSSTSSSSTIVTEELTQEYVSTTKHLSDTQT